MITATQDFMDQLYDSPGSFVENVTITLTNNTVLSLDNTRLWDGGVYIEDAVSGSDDKLEVGSAIINKATIQINNIDDYFTAYDFYGAQVVVYVGLNVNGVDETYQKGIYNVDETSYDGSIITLTCLDRMSLFDEDYTTALSGSTTCTAIIQEIATRHSITVDDYTFDNSIAVTIPEDISTITDREMISYVAQICGVYARITRTGTLQFSWFDSAFTHQSTSGDYDGGFLSNYLTGDALDGGSFWTDIDTGDGGSFSWSIANAHLIRGLWSKNVAVDEVNITGVNVTCESTALDGTISDVTYSSGASGYVIGIENNPLVTTTNGQAIADYLGTILNGTHYRKATITHQCDPTFEAGDVATFVDGKGYWYNCIVSKTTFRANSDQQTVSAGESTKRQAATRYTVDTKNYVALRDKVVAEVKERMQDVSTLANRITNAGGLYATDVTSGGSTIHYWHNKPDLADSDIVMILNNIGFSMSTDGGQTWNVSMQVDGNFIAGILSVDGINANWINAGTITSREISNGSNFNVTAAGVLTAKSGTIGGWTITSNAIYKDTVDPNDSSIVYRTYLQGPLTSNPESTWFISAQKSTNGGNSFGGISWLTADGGAWFSKILKDLYIQGSITFSDNDNDGLIFYHCGSSDWTISLQKLTTVSSSSLVRLYDKTNSKEVWSYDNDYGFHVSSILYSKSMVYAQLGTNSEVGQVFMRCPSGSPYGYNTILRNDGKNAYILLTNANTEDAWNSFRPFTIDNATGSCTITGTISSSDRNKKHDIAELDDRFLDFFDRLTPVGFKWNSGSSGRQHAGFIAQDVKEALDASGIDTSEFAGYVEMEDMDGASCGLRYDQFIPVLTKKVQEQQKVIDEQQARIDGLEARLRALEDKLL